MLPKLPYPIEKGLAPLLSPEQINIHYNKIHLGYLIKANQFVERMLFLKKIVFF